MTMTTYTGVTNTIAGLGTTPQERGLTTDQFKAKFDADLTAFVAWFNDTHKTEFDAVAASIGVWQAWTPTLTWTTATPAGIVTKARYVVIGKTCFFHIFITASDGNGATDLFITLPITPVINAIYPFISGRQSINGVISSARPYINDSSFSGLNFTSFSTCADGVGVEISASGFYEIV